MRVLLLKDVPGVGQKGKEVDVKIGHAQNFLFPQNLALALTEATRNRIEEEKKTAQLRLNKIEKLSTKLLQKIQSTKLILYPLSNEVGVLFKAVSTKDVIAALEAKGIKGGIDIIFSTPIKTKGEHKILLTLPGGFQGIHNISIE